jgi:hypothetical protein
VENQTFKDPTGSTVTIGGAEVPQVLLWQSQFTVSTPMNGKLPDHFHTRTLTVTYPSNHDTWLVERGAAQVGEYSISGGTLQIWRPKQENGQGLARWVGENHAAIAYLPFKLWESHATVIEYFSGVEFLDSPEGLEAHSTVSTNSVDVLDVTGVVSGIGLLEVLAPAVGLAAVPSWKGLSVAAGEVWKAIDADNKDVVTHLVLASTRAVATLTPFSTSSLEACLGYFERLGSIDYGKAS